MKKLTLAVAVAFLLSLAGNAFAVPTIDGLVSPGTEWDTGIVIDLGDPDEAGIPGKFDISRMRMIVEDSGGADDGLYILFDLYGTPTLATDGEAGATEPFYLVELDLNQDGIRNGDDRRLILKKILGTDTLKVFNAANTDITDGSVDFDIDTHAEIFLPDSQFASWGILPFDTLAKLDNGMKVGEDFVPDSGFATTIPEPATMMLFGSGLLGALGFVRRKRSVA